MVNDNTTNLEVLKEQLLLIDYQSALTNKLNMRVVAEGVETQADWDLVANLGCDLAQGFWMSKPLPASEFIPWLENWNAER